jgi:hypothetical protein
MTKSLYVNTRVGKKKEAKTTTMVLRWKAMFDCMKPFASVVSKVLDYLSDPIQSLDFHKTYYTFGHTGNILAKTIVSRTGVATTYMTAKKIRKLGGQNLKTRSRNSVTVDHDTRTITTKYRFVLSARETEELIDIAKSQEEFARRIDMHQRMDKILRRMRNEIV